MNMRNTTTWEDVKDLHSTCLCYTKDKGLFMSPDCFTIEDDILIQPHGHKGFWHKEYPIEEENLNIRVESNFGYGSQAYLRAFIKKNGKIILDFDKSKIYMLNNCSVMSHDVASYAWEDLFDKIIKALKVSNIELCTSSAISYIEEISNVLDCDDIQIYSNYTTQNSSKRSGVDLSIHAGNKIKDLIKGCNAADISDSYFIDKTTELCQKFLDKILKTKIDLTDDRAHKLSRTLFSIHEFMINHKRGQDFLNSILCGHR